MLVQILVRQLNSLEIGSVLRRLSVPISKKYPKIQNRKHLKNFCKFLFQKDRLKFKIEKGGGLNCPLPLFYLL